MRPVEIRHSVVGVPVQKITVGRSNAAAGGRVARDSSRPAPGPGGLVCNTALWPHRELSLHGMVRRRVGVVAHLHGRELRIGRDEIFREQSAGPQRGAGDRLTCRHGYTDIRSVQRVGNGSEIAVGQILAERRIPPQRLD